MAGGGQAGRGRNRNQIGRHSARRPIAMVYPPAAARQLLRAFSDVFPFDSAIPVLSGDIGAADALLPWTALPPAGRAVAFEVDVTALDALPCWPAPMPSQNPLRRTRSQPNPLQVHFSSESPFGVPSYRVSWPPVCRFSSTLRRDIVATSR
jgi:hypothetical protein